MVIRIGIIPGIEAKVIPFDVIEICEAESQLRGPVLVDLIDSLGIELRRNQHIVGSGVGSGEIGNMICIWHGIEILRRKAAVAAEIRGGDIDIAA